MQTPASPLYSDAGEFPASISHHRRTNRIDYTKFKTKMCRHFLQGLQCPFQDRCAFSHGEDGSITLTVDSPAATYLGDSHYSHGTDSPIAADDGHFARRYIRRPPHGNDNVRGAENFNANGSEEEEDRNSDSFLPPPPPYEESNILHVEPMMDNYGAMPPAYPTRYRYNPYSYMGITYE